MIVVVFILVVCVEEYDGVVALGGMCAIRDVCSERNCLKFA